MTKKIILLFAIVLIFAAGGFFYWWQNPGLIWLGRAQVSLVPEEKPEEEVGQELSEEEIETVEEELDIEAAPEPKPAQPLTLEELQAILNDIARQIDILTQEVAELIEEQAAEEELEEEEREFEGCQENQLNVNIALTEGLEELHGIGPVLAQKIIEERQKELFYTLDDLTRVQGIGEKTVAGIREQGIACAGSFKEGAAFLDLDQDDKEEKDTKEDVCWVNINTAPTEELQKITGVGPVIAQKIIEARPFYSLFDLIRVSGIGETTLQKIIAQGCAYASGYTGGGAPPVPPPPSYPKILISEVQIEEDNVNHDFIELYNSDNSNVDISGYKLRKRASTGNESSIRVFPSGSLIPAQGYYLWASSKDENYPSSISANNSTTQTLASNNSLALLAPDNVIISALAWGSSTSPFMETSPFPDNPGENKSLGRTWLEETGEYKNTGNNSVDFEIQVPTPKAQNQAPGPEPVIEYNLTIDIIGEGTTTPAFGTSTYEKNEEVMVTAHPGEGWRFIGWTGDLVSEEAVMTIVMDEVKSIMANFEKEEPEIIEPPMNFLLNEFFEEWEEEGNKPDYWKPTYWVGSHSFKTNWFQDSEHVLVGDYSVHVSGGGERDFDQFIHMMEEGIEYYGEIWIKGIGGAEVRIGIRDGHHWNYGWSDWETLTTGEWKKITAVRIPTGTGDGGGLRIRTNDGGEEQEIYIGAVWLGTAPPTDDWPF